MPATPELMAKLKESLEHLDWCFGELKSSDDQRDFAREEVEKTLKALEVDKAHLEFCEETYQADVEQLDAARIRVNEDIAAVFAPE